MRTLWHHLACGVNRVIPAPSACQDFAGPTACVHGARSRAAARHRGSKTLSGRGTLPCLSIRSSSRHGPAFGVWLLMHVARFISPQPHLRSAEDRLLLDEDPGSARPSPSPRGAPREREEMLVPCHKSSVACILRPRG